MKSFRRAVSLLSRRDRSIYFILVFARAALNLLDVAGLVAVGVVASSLVTTNSQSPQSEIFGFSLHLDEPSHILIASFIAGAFFLIKSILSVIVLRATLRFGSAVESKSAFRLANELFLRGLDRLKAMDRGEIHHAMALSLQQATSGLLISGASLITEGSLLLFVFLIFLLVDPLTAGSIALFFLFVWMILQFVVNRRLAVAGQEISDAVVGLTNSLQDLLVAYREIQIFSRQAWFIRALAEHRSAFADRMARQNFLIALPRALVETSLMLLILGVVGIQVVLGRFDEAVPVLAVFFAGGMRMLAAFLPFQSALANLKGMGPQADLAQRLISEANLGLKLVPAQEKPGPEPTRERTPLGIEFVNMGFSFENRKPILVETSLTIEAGSFVALVGVSGAGKSTLADLIVGLLEPKQGEILIGGYSARALRQLHPGAVAYVPQFPGLVTGTLADNVSLGESREILDEARLIEVLEEVRLEKLVQTLPDGIHTDLGKHSDAVSGGERQRLGLARALYRRPSVMVLDEISSSLDQENEGQISQLLERIRGEVTIITIAHRHETILTADKVLVLKKGLLIDAGDYNEFQASIRDVDKFLS